MKYLFVCISIVNMVTGNEKRCEWYRFLWTVQHGMISIFIIILCLIVKNVISLWPLKKSKKLETLFWYDINIFILNLLRPELQELQETHATKVQEN